MNFFKSILTHLQLLVAKMQFHFLISDLYEAPDLFWGARRRDAEHEVRALREKLIESGLEDISTRNEISQVTETLSRHLFGNFFIKARFMDDLMVMEETMTSQSFASWGDISFLGCSLVYIDEDKSEIEIAKITNALQGRSTWFDINFV